MIARENSTFYNSKETKVITWKPTVMDQRAQERKQALQQYFWTSPEEESIYTAKMTAMRQILKKEEMGNMYRTQYWSSRTTEKIIEY